MVASLGDEAAEVIVLHLAKECSEGRTKRRVVLLYFIVKQPRAGKVADFLRHVERGDALDVLRRRALTRKAISEEVLDVWV